MDWVEHQALCACADGSLLLWGIPGVQRAEKQHLARRLVANWPDMQAIMGCVDGRVMIWDLRLLQVLKTLAEEHPQIICMSAVPNLSELAIGAADGRLYLWSCRGGATAPSKIMDAHSSPVRVLDVDWSGRSALTSGEDGVLKFWNLTMGQCLRVLDGQDPVTCLAVHWPAALAFASAGRITKLWDLCRGRCLQSLTTGRSSVISGDWARQRLLSAGEDSMLHLRDAFRRGQCIGHLEGHTDAVLCVSVDWASTRALSGSSDRRLVLWDMAEWKSLRTFHGHRDAVRCLSVDWAKGQALSGSFDRTLLLWDLENEKALASLEGHRDWVCCVCCYWPGRKALSGGREGALKLWDLDTASCTLTLEGHPDAVWSVALNLTEASAGRALSAGRDRQLRLWCLAEGRLLRCLAGHQDAVRSLDVDWASQQVLSCGFDNVLRLWNLESSEHIQEFEGHTRGFISTIKLTFGEPSRAFHPTNRCDLLQRGLDLGHGGIWRRRQHGAALGHFRRR
ncbi:unnamed protein product [Effrenium voratum]|nr:unnamed protein product [Effrenium voratum]